jgi:hypothetical protein
MIGRRGAGANQDTLSGQRRKRGAGQKGQVGTVRALLGRHDWGMYGVGLAAAVLSFDQLWRLALLCGWPPSIAWLLAVIIDAYAVNATRRWLRAGVDGDLRRWAGILVWGCVGLSMAGNTVEHALGMGYLRMPDGRPEWWIVVIVGTVPTVMLASLIHLEAMSRAAHAASAMSSKDDRHEKPGPVSKRARLVALLDGAPPETRESNYQVAKRFGPEVGLNVQSATRYVRLWREAKVGVAEIGRGREAAS